MMISVYWLSVFEIIKLDINFSHFKLSVKLILTQL